MNNSTNNSLILPRAGHAGLQTIIFLSGILTTILALCLVFQIMKRIFNIKKELKLLKRKEVLESDMKNIIKMKTNQNKHFYLLCVTLLIIGHRLGRSIIYFNFILLLYYGTSPECNPPRELRFIFDFRLYIYAVLAISDTLFIASVIGIGTTILYVRETYNYFGKNLKTIKRWVCIGLIQICIVLLFMAIPYVTILGGVLFSCVLIVDNGLLIFAKNRLLKILHMKKIDADYQSDIKFRYKQCIRAITRLSFPFLISLSIYSFGLVLEHAAAWVTTLECFLEDNYSVTVTNMSIDIQLKNNVASFLWIMIYVTVIQFDVTILLIVTAYFCYSKYNKRALEGERKRLMAGVIPKKYNNAGYEEA